MQQAAAAMVAAATEAGMGMPRRQNRTARTVQTARCVRVEGAAQITQRRTHGANHVLTFTRTPINVWWCSHICHAAGHVVVRSVALRHLSWPTWRVRLECETHGLRCSGPTAIQQDCQRASNAPCSHAAHMKASHSSWLTGHAHKTVHVHTRCPERPCVKAVRKLS